MGREAFARFYQRAWATGVLPLRHPWIKDEQDYLFGLGAKLRDENDGWAPEGQEHTFERVQIAEWMRLCADFIKTLPGEGRCLEWDSGRLSRRFFARHCDFVDVITYQEDSAGW